MRPTNVEETSFWAMAQNFSARFTLAKQQKQSTSDDSFRETNVIDSPFQLDPIYGVLRLVKVAKIDQREAQNVYQLLINAQDRFGSSIGSVDINIRFVNGQKEIVSSKGIRNEEANLSPHFGNTFGSLKFVSHTPEKSPIIARIDEDAADGSFVAVIDPSMYLSTAENIQQNSYIFELLPLLSAEEDKRQQEFPFSLDQQTGLITLRTGTSDDKTMLNVNGIFLLLKSYSFGMILISNSIF